jgi:hypothetical protein
MSGFVSAMIIVGYIVLIGLAVAVVLNLGMLLVEALLDVYKGMTQ